MIEFFGIEKSFGAKEVLCGIDLTVREGEVTFIIGTSGTGKSVLMKHARDAFVSDVRLPI